MPFSYSLCPASWISARASANREAGNSRALLTPKWASNSRWGTPRSFRIAASWFHCSWVMVADDLAGLVKAGDIAKYQVTRRKAIVYLLGLKAGKALELRYRLKATMPVKVTVPPARVYEYYDPDKEGLSSSMRLEVK